MGVLNAKVGTEWVPISASNNVDHWNSAWGTVAMGSFKSGLASPVTLAGTFQQLTEPIVINTLGGRRYRINYQMRAINAVSATASSANFMVYDGGVPRGDLGDWYSLTITTGAVYSGPDWGAVIEGDGATHTYTIVGSARGALMLWLTGTTTVASTSRTSARSLDWQRELFHLALTGRRTTHGMSASTCRPKEALPT